MKPNKTNLNVTKNSALFTYLFSVSIGTKKPFTSNEIITNGCNVHDQKITLLLLFLSFFCRLSSKISTLNRWITVFLNWKFILKYNIFFVQYFFLIYINKCITFHFFYYFFTFIYFELINNKIFIFIVLHEKKAT